MQYSVHWPTPKEQYFYVSSEYCSYTYSQRLYKWSLGNKIIGKYLYDSRKLLAGMGLAGATLKAMANDNDEKWGEEHEIERLAFNKKYV